MTSQKLIVAQWPTKNESLVKDWYQYRKNIINNLLLSFLFLMQVYMMELFDP